MSKEYNHLKIEKKWQREWEKKGIFKAKDSSTSSTSSLQRSSGRAKRKFYSLIEFPFPSGDGLHVGHIRSNTAMDIISRKRRMEGYNVIYPIGWDAFGLPTENYAIKTGISPEIVAKRNTDNFRRQLKALGFSFDWSREINTTDPKYYKWTQWIFLQLLKKNLAYKAKIAVNWCPKDKTGLANEEVINGCCERCGTPVVKKEKEQWLLKITKYADRLDKELDSVDYLEKIKIQQRNWIGRSEGAEIEFEVWRGNEKIKVYTTRPDTIWGSTYVVLSPEHELIKKLWNQIENKDDISKYLENVKSKTEIERTSEERDTSTGSAVAKTGVKVLGLSAINPANKEVIPVYIADYVLSTYGTGAIMAVPAHDERDFVFAKKYNLPIKEVITPFLIDKHDPPVVGKKTIHKKVVQCVVYNPDKDKILVLKWEKFSWISFVSGGVEDGEDPKNTALREIEEETGYFDIGNIEKVGKEFFTTYHATHKDENRVAEVCTFIIRLRSEKKNDTRRNDSEKFRPMWVLVNEARKIVNQVEAPRIWDILDNKADLYSGNGLLINSDKFSGMDSEKVKKEITKFVGGKWVTKYKLRDWVFSRQRYWGEPIPVVHCGVCGVVPLSEKDLPLKLPELKNYQPRDDGESPLASATSWVLTKCPKCKRMAKRETDTMPNWAGSSWYFLRYIDPKNPKKLADYKKLKNWMPVDWYNGGMEHTTLHLLYSRFWHKFLNDIGVVPGIEPYKKRTSHGIILAGGGEKMSKSKGNVVNPDSVVKTYGADTLRMYEMFIGPFDQTIAWNEDNIFGVRRFIERVWRIKEKVKHDTNPRIKTNDTNRFEILLNRTIKKVTEDIESMAFNTAVSAMMILLNEMERVGEVTKKDFEAFLKILNPFAPHITEEIWHELGNRTLLAKEKWPKADPKKLLDDEVRIAVQVNSRVRGECLIGRDALEGEVVRTARANPDVEKWLLGKEIKKVIYVPNRILNFVV